MSNVNSFDIDIHAKRDVKYKIVKDDPHGDHGSDIAAFKDDVIINGNVVESNQGLALVDDLKDMREASDFTPIPAARLITPSNHEPMYLYTYALDGKSLDQKYTYSTQWMFCAEDNHINPFDASNDDTQPFSMFFETSDTHELLTFDTHQPLRHPTYMRFDSYVWDLDKVMDRLGIVLSNDDGEFSYSMEMPKPGATSGTMRANMSKRNQEQNIVMDDRINETLEVCYLFEQNDYEQLYREHGGMAIVNPTSTDIAYALCITDCML